MFLLTSRMLGNTRSRVNKAFCTVILHLHVMTMQIFHSHFAFTRKNEGEILQRISLKLVISRCFFLQRTAKKYAKMLNAREK